jgi:hypothetical protein
MRLIPGRLSRRELALVAAAALLPVPILTISGVSAPLPDAIERGIGSVVTLDAEDERSGVEATGDVAEHGNTQRRSERGRLRITRKGGVTRMDSLAGIVGPETAAGGAANDGQTHEDAGSSGEGEAPAEGEPEGDGNGGPSSPGSPKSPGTESPESSGSGVGPASGADGEPELRVTAAGQGTGAGVSVGTSGVSVDENADTGGAGSNSATVDVGLTDSDGSTTGLRVDVPASGVSLP